ncbi:hypothetical protein N7457_001535 [Penicillium paradoxum]|uniref:uncharacterized protein n=1 Tax=Penicillium paradoxum TaxID=176176 RepID=UPI002549A977|nr:uncharacterized protein N7457_001535 [Penicillium paradoxum]KAJ5794936.1 hypothetical protein N7457_001535 [Penicillium paradoxum]
MVLAAGGGDRRAPLLFITVRGQSQMAQPAVSVTPAFLGFDSSAEVMASTPQKDRPALENHGLVLVLVLELL